MYKMNKEVLIITQYLDYWECAGSVSKNKNLAKIDSGSQLSTTVRVEGNNNNKNQLKGPEEIFVCKKYPMLEKKDGSWRQIFYETRLIDKMLG